jgi:hypothetical protein
MRIVLVDSSLFTPPYDLRLGERLAELPLDAIRFVSHVRRLRPDAVHFQWLSIQLIDLWIVNRLKNVRT